MRILGTVEVVVSGVVQDADGESCTRVLYLFCTKGSGMGEGLDVPFAGRTRHALAGA